MATTPGVSSRRWEGWRGKGAQGPGGELVTELFQRYQRMTGDVERRWARRPAGGVGAAGG